MRASNVYSTGFPQYDSWFGKMVGQFLNGELGSLDSVDPHFSALLYAGDRFEAKSKIESALAEGKIVLIDRYIGSNLAHQTARVAPAKREEFGRWIRHLEYEIYDLPREDRVIYLRVPPGVAQKLVNRKSQRTYTNAKQDLLEASLRHLQDAADMYDSLSREVPWVTIECFDPARHAVRPPDDNRHGGLGRDSSGHRQPACVTVEFRSTLMGFSEFLAINASSLLCRARSAADACPTLCFSPAPAGVGKFTLARMFAQAANCERLTGDFCGQCHPCQRIALLCDPQKLIEQGIAERGESADAATVERTPPDPAITSRRPGPSSPIPFASRHPSHGPCCASARSAPFSAPLRSNPWAAAVSSCSTARKPCAAMSPMSASKSLKSPLAPPP
jgi:dTMP kinase